jgi:hypothetical protein
LLPRLLLLCAAAAHVGGCGAGDGPQDPDHPTAAQGAQPSPQSVADPVQSSRLDTVMSTGFVPGGIGRQQSGALQFNDFHDNVFEIHGCEVRYHYGQGTLLGGTDLPSYVILNSSQVQSFQIGLQQQERRMWDWDLLKIGAKQLRNCLAGLGATENPGDAAGLNLALASGFYPEQVLRHSSGALQTQDFLDRSDWNPPADVFEIHGCEVRYHAGEGTDPSTDLPTYVVLERSQVQFLQSQLAQSAAGLQSDDPVLVQAAAQLGACP